MFNKKFWKSILEDERFQLKEGYPDFNRKHTSFVYGNGYFIYGT